MLRTATTESVRVFRYLGGQIKSDLTGISLLKKVGLYSGILIVLAFTLFPVYYMVLSAIVPESHLYGDTPPLLPVDVTFEYLIGVATGSGIESTGMSGTSIPFPINLKNTLIISLTTTILALVVAIPGGYSFARFSYPGRILFSRGVLIIYMFGGIVLVVPLFRVLLTLNLIDTYRGIILVTLVKALPVSLYMLGSYFRSIPASIEEAAMIDGYSIPETIARVTVPLSMPAIATVFLYVFIISWNEYLFASIFLRSNDMLTLSVSITQIAVNQTSTPWGVVMAATTLMSVPVLVMFLYLQKYLISGLSFEGLGY